MGAFHCLGGLEELSWADVWTRELEQAVLLEFFWSRFLAKFLETGVFFALKIGDAGCFGILAFLKESKKFK